MSPTPPLQTNRLRVRYDGPFNSHTMLWHGVLGTTQGDLVDSVASVMTLMAALWFDGTNTPSAEYAEAGNNLYFPVSFPLIVSSSGQTPTGTDDPGIFLQFGGRDRGATRVKLYLFEFFGSTTRDMRYGPGEIAAADAVIADLRDKAAFIGTRSGEAPIWKDYTNVSSNKKIIRKARG